MSEGMSNDSRSHDATVYYSNPCLQLRYIQELFCLRVSQIYGAISCLPFRDHIQHALSSEKPTAMIMGCGPFPEFAAVEVRPATRAEQAFCQSSPMKWPSPWWILPGLTLGTATQSISLQSRANCRGSPGAAFGHARTRESTPWVLPGLSSPASNADQGCWGSACMPACMNVNVYERHGYMYDSRLLNGVWWFDVLRGDSEACGYYVNLRSENHEPPFRWYFRYLVHHARACLIAHCLSNERKKVVRRWALVTHGESGSLSDPHAPLGTLSPRGLCEPSRTPLKRALRTLFRSRDSNTGPMAAIRITLSQSAPMDRRLPS